MRFVDIVGLCFSIIGAYGLILYTRYLFPRNAIPLLSARLIETQQFLDHAEAIRAVPLQSECRTLLDRSADDFADMRMQSNRGRGTFQQLRLTLLQGLTYKLYVLYGRVDDIQAELEVAVDKQQLAIAASASGTAVPDPAAATATPTSSVIEMTLPLPATTS